MVQLARRGHPPFKDLAYTRKNILPLLGVEQTSVSRTASPTLLPTPPPSPSSTSSTAPPPSPPSTPLRRTSTLSGSSRASSASSQRSNVQMEDNSLFFNNETLPLPSDSLLDVTFQEEYKFLSKPPNYLATASLWDILWHYAIQSLHDIKLENFLGSYQRDYT